MAPNDSPPPVSAPAPAASPRRILVAEDHSISRHLLSRSLANWGFEAICVQDGEEAMAALNGENPPSIAIVDWMMPKLDGLEVCRRVRAQEGRPYLYLLLLTAKSHKEEVTLGLQAGADDYVIKPFDPDELQARIKVGQRVVRLERQLAGKVRELEAALADVRRLKTLIPICSYCHRVRDVRDDKDYWRRIEEYLHEETGADFTHGICPSCLEKVQGERAGRKCRRGGDGAAA